MTHHRHGLRTPEENPSTARKRALTGRRALTVVAAVIALASVVALCLLAKSRTDNVRR